MLLCRMPSTPFRKGWAPRDSFLEAIQNNWSTQNAEESLIENARRMVGSWGAVPWLVRTRNVSYESMATFGPGCRMAKRAGPFYPSRKRRRSNPEGNTAMVEILLPKFSKLRREEGLPQKQMGRSHATIPSRGTSGQGQEGLLTQRYQRSQKREDELVSWIMESKKCFS